MRAITLSLAAAVSMGAALSALGQGPLDVTSTPVTGVTADAIASLPNGTVWSVDLVRNTISETTFPDLQVRTFTVPTADSGLAGITAGPDGNVWFTESSGKKIGRIEPNGTISEFGIPTGAAPPQRIFPGPNGTLWATSCPYLEPLFFGCDKFIVITPSGLAEPQQTLLPIRTPSGTSFGPDRCALGGDNYVWCIGNESTQNPFSSQFKVAPIDSTGGYAAYSPATGLQGSAIVYAPDTKIYYTWQRAGESTGIASVSSSGVITEYPVMTGNQHSWMFGLSVGGDRNLYFADRQTSILYQFTPSTATFNSGPISIDIPEDIVPGGGSSSAGCLPGGAFVVRSGGSLFGELVWVRTQSPTECTNLIADVDFLRFASSFNSGFATCYDAFDSHNDAKTAVLSLRLPAGSQVSTNVSTGFNFAAGTCTVTGSNVRCDAPIIKKDFDFEVQFVGIVEAGSVFVSCSSATPESDPEDNDDEDDSVIGLPSVQSPPVDRTSRELLRTRRVPHGITHPN